MADLGFSLWRSGVALSARGRGLQMLVKRTRLGLAGDGPMRQVEWLESHDRELTDVLLEAVSTTG